MGGELTNPNKYDKDVLSVFSVGDNSYGNITYLNKKELNIKKLFFNNYYQFFAIDVNNNLYSWGLNNYYQLANGNKSNYLFNTNESSSKKTNETNFSIISNTSENTLSKTIKSIGKIFSSPSPIPIPVAKIKSISCGDGFTLFLDTDGKVYSVGRNDKGQLGYELNNNSAQFVDGIKCNNKVTLIDFFVKKMIKIQKIACGSDFSFALEFLNTSIDVDFNNLRLTQKIPEELFAWGSNELHQLGIEEKKYKYYFTPTKANLVNKILNKQKTKIKNLVCGWSHACLLAENDNVYLWGNPFKEYNKKYQDIETPININNMKNVTKIISISSGYNHIAILCLSLKKQNLVELYTYGANEFGQLGYPTDEVYIDKFNKVNIPKSEVNENLHITKVECGACHTIVQMGSNLIYGFGQNNCKQIGNYNEEFLTTPKKWNYIMNVDSDKTLYDIKCSNDITCLLFKNKSDIENKDNTSETNNSKNEFEIQVNSFITEDMPLK